MKYLFCYKYTEKQYIFIAFVEDKIKININEEGFLQIWNLEGSVKYFPGYSEGYIILFRVYEIEEEIDESLPNKGRSGRNYYYALTEKYIKN
ncbi:Uncharacterised protein [[Clostridium] sordellii]|uniref:hypothetical protein n=1 Tax=Paraclostridium sordellii TaxID=1505 RepID=UPI0005DAC20B|nr:hypothetical protein [Paeniclostridium sordellii]CEO35428.1 Uncharacterised protein [[Clostridium] sordellii] [Paeniclostridium sordellii]CEP92804.1 Uncharacterised protein [[Clostridium] sordellii] [Paeniclostridium sordellii]